MKKIIKHSKNIILVNNYKNIYKEINKMKKMIFILFLVCLAFGSRAVAQEDTDTLVVIIWAEDAVGNRDTVRIYMNAGATNGLDTAFGEVNLYGVEPQGDLDLRIIQRTDMNYYNDDYLKYPMGTYWLTGFYDPGWESNDGSAHQDVIGYGWCPTFKQNVDLKKNYVPIRDVTGWHSDNHIAIYCNAVNYPIKIYVCLQYDSYTISSTLWFGECRATIHNTTQGNIIYYDCFNIWSWDCQMPFTIKTLEQNYIIYLNFTRDLSAIKDNIEEKMLYPNPADKDVILDDVSIGTHNLLDENGSILKTFSVDAVPYELNIENLPVGSYFITDISNTYLFHFIKK